MQVERALILWRDDHLEYDCKTKVLKHLRKTSAQDFSGTNYKSITLGWLERIREKRKRDTTFFAKVCKEAHNIHFAAAGKGKLSGSADNHSDLEIEERAGVMSDASDDLDEGTSNTAKGMPLAVWDLSRDAMQDAANDGGAIDGGNRSNGGDEGAIDGGNGSNSGDGGANGVGNGDDEGANDGGNGDDEGANDGGNGSNGDDEEHESVDDSADDEEHEGADDSDDEEHEGVDELDDGDSADDEDDTINYDTDELYTHGQDRNGNGFEADYCDE